MSLENMSVLMNKKNSRKKGSVPEINYSTSERKLFVEKYI